MVRLVVAIPVVVAILPAQLEELPAFHLEQLGRSSLLTPRFTVVGGPFPRGASGDDRAHTGDGQREGVLPPRMMPPAPIRMREVPAATWPMSTEVAALPIPGML